MDKAVKLDPVGMVRDIRLAPHQLIERVTPQEDVFVLAHLGIPRIDLSSWRLEISGLVERPRTFTFEEILQLPIQSVETFHQCAGFPRRSDIPTRRVANVVWSGADLGEMLRVTKIKSEAKFLLAHGLDHGTFENFPESGYVKDMPLQRLKDGGVLLAYEINGKPLTPEHGYPLRLVIPGYYGTNSVKWLGRLELAGERSTGIFTKDLYNDPIAPGSGASSHATRPLWEAGPEAIIVEPKNRSILDRGTTELWGWAWASNGVERVDISVDGGVTWQTAFLEKRHQWSWQRFSAQWTPTASGSFRVMARATDVDGASQPMKHARNAVHAVRIEVASS